MKHSLLFLRAVLTLPLAFELAALPMPAVPDRQTALPDISNNADPVKHIVSELLPSPERGFLFLFLPCSFFSASTTTARS
jgi:hypothetical protein